MSVQLAKECAEQQGNAVKRQKQEIDKGRRRKLMKIAAIFSLYIYVSLP